MANADRPQGASLKGEPLRLNVYVAESTIYPGDFVKQNANGTVEPASASNALIGVAVAYAAAGSRCQVSDHPDQQYVVQADESDINAQTDIGLNYDIVATSGSSTFKASRMELDSSSGATTATLPLKLLDIERRPDNSLGAQVDCIVKINNHQLNGGTGTAGV